MELPKHTTQVGTIAANKKLYLEDYCISYMKQLTEEKADVRKQIALFGTMEREKNVEYVFVYGAALIGEGRERTDSLTANQKEEAEAVRTEFFEGYQLVGVVISTDAVNENIFWMGSGTKSIPMDGYYIFYDANEAMLNYMMHDQKEERAVDLDPVIVKKADMDREKRERAEREKAEVYEKGGKYRRRMQEEKAEVYEKNGKYRRRMQEEKSRDTEKKTKSRFPAVACVMLLAIGGVYGVKEYYPQLDMRQVQTYWEALKERATGLQGTYLQNDSAEESALTVFSSENLLQATGDEKDSQGTQNLPISSVDIQQPAEMDVIKIPDLDELETDDQTTQSAENTQNTGNTQGTGNTQDTGNAQGAGGTQGTDNTQGTGGTQGAGNAQGTDNTQNTDNVQDGPQEYYIMKGDNLLKILRAHYGNESKLQEVIDLNGIVDPNNIQVGQTILLP